MARHFGVSVRTVQRWKGDLIQAGLLIELQRIGRAPFLVPYPNGMTAPSDERQNPISTAPSEDKTVTGGVTNLTPLSEKKTEKENVVPFSEISTTCEETPSEPNVNVDCLRLEEKNLDPLPPVEPETAYAQGTEAPPSNPAGEGEDRESVEPLTNDIPGPQDTYQGEQTRIQHPCEAPTEHRNGTVFDMDLVRQIETVTHDYGSRGAWIQIIQRVDRDSIFMAMSATRDKLACESAVNPGRYFIGCVRHLDPHFEFTRSKRGGTSQPSRGLNDFLPKTEDSQFSGDLPTSHDIPTVSTPMDQEEAFRLGQRNCQIIRAWKEGRISAAEMNRLVNEPL
jgi:hypothetical protein